MRTCHWLCILHINTLLTEKAYARHCTHALFIANNMTCNIIWFPLSLTYTEVNIEYHDDVIKWKHFPRYWPFVRGIHRPPRGWWFETPSSSLWRQCNDFGDLSTNQVLITSSVKDSLERAKAWWRHQMETFSALLAICAGNSPVPGEFPAQRPVTQSFDVFFDLRPNKRLSKQS